MKIFKFGGISIQNAESIHNVTKILQSHSEKKIVAIISAIGKTTNELEKLLFAFFNNQDEKFTLFNDIKDKHEKILSDLFDASDKNALTDIHAQFDLLHAYLTKEPSENFDFEYDQIVSFGELFSSKIISHYLNKQHIQTLWMDARKLVITDNSYREANVNWEKTGEKGTKNH